MTDQTPKPPELPRRFYATATVTEAEGKWRILLDGRQVRTPGRAVLEVVSWQLADAMAQEWSAQGERIDPASMPLTRLVNTAVDGVAPRLDETRDDLCRYVETDLLFYRADGPERLVRRQAELWDPILKWAAGRLGGSFNVTSGVMHVRQPPKSVAAVAAMLAHVDDPLAVAALHQMTTITGSVLLALAVLEGRLEASDAFGLAHVDEDWNIELWGDDEEASLRRAARLADMRSAGMLLQLAGRPRQMPANQS